MSRLKTYQTTLDIANPIGFATNSARHAMIMIRETFLGKCFMGAFITEITRIIRKSDCRIVSTNDSASGSVDVEFEAKVVILARWDMIIGAEVLKTDVMILASVGDTPLKNRSDEDAKASDVDEKTKKVGASDADEKTKPAGAVEAAKVTVAFSPTPETKTFQIGQKVCARVVEALHAPTVPTITASCVMLTCDTAAPEYVVKGAFTPQMALEVAPLMADINAELGLRPGVDRNRLMYFESLLYSYKRSALGADAETPSAAGGRAYVGLNVGKHEKKDETAVHILDLVRNASKTKQDMTGCWCRPLTTPRSSPLVTRKSKPASTAIATVEPIFAVLSFLKQIRDFLYATRAMAELYSSKAMLDDHANIWKAMGAAQLASETSN